MKLLLPTLLCGMAQAVCAISSAQCLAGSPLSGMGANNNATGTIPWSNPSHAEGLTADGSFSTATATLVILGTPVSNYLTMTNLGFHITLTDIICGIEVVITRRDRTTLTLGDNSTITDNSVRLINGGTLIGAEQARTSIAWPATAAPVTYGGPGNLWGTGTLIPADINSSGFGVAIAAQLTGTIGLSLKAQIDNITVKVYSSAGSTLPIILQSFTAKSSADGNILAWTAWTTGTAGTAGTAGPAGIDKGVSDFAIERSSGSRAWQTLTTIPATTGQSNYTWTDTDPLPGASSYRLRLSDGSGNGTYTYSPIQTIAQQTLTGVHCYPNPFTSTINISSTHPIGKIVLKDVQGRVLRVKEPDKNTSNWQWPASDLPPGLYFIQVDGSVFKLVKK